MVCLARVETGGVSRKTWCGFTGVCGARRVLSHRSISDGGTASSRKEPANGLQLKMSDQTRVCDMLQVSELSNQGGASWRVLNLDLRCHGNSTQLPGFNAPHTMQACAQDVCSFIQQRLQYVPCTQCEVLTECSGCLPCLQGNDLLCSL